MNKPSNGHLPTHQASEMNSYQYFDLVDELKEIRLLLLRPGEFDDDLRVAISHVSLIEPVSRPGQLLSLSEVRSAFPLGWQVFEAINGRYIVEHPESNLTTWVHPDHSNVSAHEKVGNAPYGTFQPNYEAL
jgi:hypothetical protein